MPRAAHKIDPTRFNANGNPRKREAHALEGRPPFKPTPAQRKSVDNMAAMGMTERQISEVMDIDRNTLRKHFAHELHTARFLADLQVTNNLFARTAKDTEACKFWLMNRQWRNWGNGPRTSMHLTVEARRPDLSKLSPAKLAQLKTAIKLMRSLEPKTIEHDPVGDSSSSQGDLYGQDEA